MLPGACYTVTASIGGQVAGSFRLELRGEASPARSNGQATSTALPKKNGHGKPR
jgi:hypothetical protein